MAKQIKEFKDFLLKMARNDSQDTPNASLSTVITTTSISTATSVTDSIASTNVATATVTAPTTTIEVDDDGSSSSDNTASSTSGCSSLVPSHQDNLQRLHFPKSSIDRLRQELDKTCNRYGLSKTSAGKEDESNRNSSALWTSRGGNREFDSSKFIASGSSIPFPVRTVTSPFYPGPTRYGGASTRRVDMLASSPYNLNQRRLAPILRVRANETNNHNLVPEDRMSSAARKILESMDRVSSPLEEAKKMPLRGKAHPYSRGPTRITDRLNISQSLRPLNSGMNSTIKTITNSSYMISSTTTVKDQPNTATSIPHPKINWTVPKVDSSTNHSIFNNQQPIPVVISNELNTTKGGGGKIKSAKISGRGPLIRDNENDVSNDVILPNVELPLPKKLPSFNFGLSNSKEEQEVVITDKEPVNKKLKEQIILNEKIEEDDYTFSSLVVRSRNKLPDVCDTFNFSSPKPHGHPESSLSSKSSSSSFPTQETPSTASWGNMFKPATGSWECPDCMVNNVSTSLNCVACERVKP